MPLWYNRTKLAVRQKFARKRKYTVSKDTDKGALMAQLDNTTFAQTIAAIVAAFGGAALGAQKILKSWKTTSAETGVVELLHNELDRLSTQNTTLAEELNKLQIQVVNLNRELGYLVAENQRLHIEVGALTAEISVLKSMLHKGEIDGSTN